jgi:hypothetical protein
MGEVRERARTRNVVNVASQRKQRVILTHGLSSLEEGASRVLKFGRGRNGVHSLLPAIGQFAPH